MQTDLLITRKDLARVSKNVARLKRQVFRLRRLVRQKDYRNDLFVKSGEVCKILRISASTLQTMRKRGKIPYSRLGGMLIYQYEDVKNLLPGKKTIANERHSNKQFYTH